MKKPGKTGQRAPRGPIARLPLPKKGEKRHPDRKKYDRRREKDRLRRELETRCGRILRMGPVWRLIKGQKDMCHRCGREIVDFPAVGRVVDFQFRPEEKYCWDCYRYLTPFVDEIAPESADPFQPVTKPAIP